MPEAPFDRCLVLAATVSSMRDWCTDARCQCGQVSIVPLRLMLQERPASARQTMADVALRLTCRKCAGRPNRVALVENTMGRGPIAGRPHDAGWSIPPNRRLSGY